MGGFPLALGDWRPRPQCVGVAGARKRPPRCLPGVSASGKVFLHIVKIKQTLISESFKSPKNKNKPNLRFEVQSER